MDNQSPPSSTSPSPHADLATTDAAREAWARAAGARAGVAWPSPEDSNRVHAAFYRDHLGFVVLPMPGPADVWAYTTSLHRRAVAEHAEDHGGAAPDEEKDAALWEDAREIAEKAARGPLGYIRRDKYLTASDVTDADLDAWFVPPEEGSASWRASGPARRRAHERPVCFLPGRSVAGLPLMLVDVDVGHGDAGGDAGDDADGAALGDGDLAGPWGAGLPGPKATTPRGGLHTFVLATGAERSSQGELAQGVDVVASGGTPVPLPSGRVATPGRAWVPDSIAVDNPPRVAPAALRVSPPRGRRKPAATTVPGDTGAGSEYEEDGGLGRAAEVFATPIEANVGERNRGAGILAGILARPRALPDDVVRAALRMLAEDLACSDTATAADTAAECARWQRLLTRGPRDGEFLEEVLLCWIRCRDQTRRPWRTSHVRRLAASLWKTCSRREGHPGDRDEDGREACAGAEDFSVGPTVGGLPRGVDAGTTWRWCPPTPTPAETPAREDVAACSPAPGAQPAPAESPRVDVFNAPLQPAPSQPTSAPAGEGPKWRGGIDPRTYLRGLSDFYPLESLARDQERRPVRIADVHPLVDFATGNHHARTVRPGYGWGPDLDLALGGLSPGDVRFLGAAGAGAGKTWFECFLANGLALATAERMLGTPGYEDASVVLPVWVTEMPKRGELLHRLAGQYLGFDLACLANGVDAHMAPGVTAHARDMSRGSGGSASAPVITAEAVVAHARDLTRRHLDTLRERSPLGIAYHDVIKVIDLAKLPARGGKGGGGYGRGAPDHRSGPELVNHVADGVDLYAEELSRRLAIPRSKVLVLVLVDPGQRFSGGGHDAKAGIDDFFMAIVQVLAGELECAVIGTLDTTKYAAANLGIDAFLGDENTGRLAADMVGGSQTIMHNADIIGLCAEVPPPDRPLLTTMWARVLKGRTGVAAEAYPFGWEKNLGRFRAAPAEGLRARQEEDRRSSSHGQRTAGHPMPRGKPATALGRVPAALMRTRQAGETDD